MVSHGDFSPRNVLIGDGGLVLIDFDRLQMAGAGRDVQHLAAWAWVTEVTAGRVDPVAGWALGDRFEIAYPAATPGGGADELAAHPRVPPGGIARAHRDVVVGACRRIRHRGRWCSPRPSVCCAHPPAFEG